MMSASTGLKQPFRDGGGAGSLLQVEVAYATPEKQVILQLQVPPGTTVAEAIEASGVRQQFAEIDKQPVVGIFSYKVPLEHQIAGGDRVEIYRPLLLDPKLSRRLKVEQQRSEQKRAGQLRRGQPRVRGKKHH